MTASVTTPEAVSHLRRWFMRSAVWWRWPVTRTTVVQTPQGPLKEISTYRRGLRGELIKHGLHSKHLGDEVIVEEHYYEGVLHGPYRQRELTGAYSMGKKHGTWECALPSETPPEGRVEYRMVEHWDRGLQDGLFQWWDREGKLCFSHAFQRGILVTPVDNPSGSLLLARISEGKLSDSKLQDKLLQPVNLEYRQTPLNVVWPDCVLRHRLLIAFRSRTSANGWLKFQERGRTVNVNAIGIPLYAGLEAILRPQSLLLDYRYGVLCVVDADDASTWRDRTGVMDLHPPLGTELEKRLDAPAKVTWREPLPVAIRNIGADQQISVDLRIQPRILAPEKRDSLFDDPTTGWPALPREVWRSRVGNDTVPLEPLPLTLRQVLGLLLDQAKLHCHEENGVLIIEPLADDAADRAGNSVKK